MKKKSSPQIREYGRRENEFVLAQIFNPEASGYQDLEFVEHTAEKACGQAERAFGDEDPLHLEALFNLALFYWKRLQDPVKAEASLTKAAKIMSQGPARQEELITELLAVGSLVQLQKGHLGEQPLVMDEIVRRIPQPFGIPSDQPAEAQSMEIYTRMAEIALSSRHPILPYLVSELGRPFALELAKAGKNKEAVQVLSTSLPPLYRKVWGSNNHQERRAWFEAQWLKKPEAEDIELQHDLERLAFDLGKVRESVSLAREISVEFQAAAGAFSEMLLEVDQLIQTPVEHRLQRMEGTIQSLLEVVQQVNEVSDPENLPNDPNHPHARPAKTLLIPTFTAIACLYLALPGPQKADYLEWAIEYLKTAISMLYSDGSLLEEDPAVMDRIRVLLADAYSRRIYGTPEDNANQILVHTDSLDLEKEKDPYYWALGKFLRGYGYFQRKNEKQQAALESDPTMANTDFQISIIFFQEALGVFTQEQFPYERALVILFWLAALESILTIEDAPELKDTIFWHSYATEEIFTPINSPYHWTSVQINRARIAAIFQEGYAEDWSDQPLEILFRAQVFITKEEQPPLWGKITYEKAQILGASDDQERRRQAVIHYRNCLDVFGQPESPERFEVLCELSELLFSDEYFDEAISVLQEAISLGEWKFNHSHSMTARRVAVSDMEGLSKMLAYCLYQTDRLDEAVTTLDGGKSRLLMDSLHLQQTDTSLLGVEDSRRAEQLRREIRQLEANGYGGIAFLEHTERLIEARQEFKALFPDGLSPGRQRGYKLDQLSDLPADTAIVMPLVSEQGSVAFIITSGQEKMTSRHVIPLPSLTTAEVRNWLSDPEVCGWLPVQQQRKQGLDTDESFKRANVKVGSLIWTSFMKKVCERLREFKVREIVFVPSEGLQFLPIWASGEMDVQRQTEWQLIDEFRFRMLPSAGALALLKKNPRPKVIKKQALIAGITAYEQQASLPKVEDEVRFIAEAFGVEPLLNESVSRSELAKRLSESSVFHLACHGAQWAGDPNFGRSFSPQPVLMLTSEGFSFRDILLEWDLQRTSLVTLSACDTGLVDFSRPWDEFEGLSHVLLQAGAGTVIGSLWSVEDQSTALLMIRFYQNLLHQEIEVTEALRQAQCWLRESSNESLAAAFPEIFRPGATATPRDRPFEHPYYWAPFFVTGL